MFVTRNEVAFPCCGHLRQSFDGLAEVQQILDALFPDLRIDGQARLDDHHDDSLDLVDQAELLPGAERVDLHLRIVFRRDLHAFAVFEVRDQQFVPADHDAVRGPESVRDPFGQVQLRLQRDVRPLSEPERLTVKLGYVVIRVSFHLILEERILPELVQLAGRYVFGHVVDVRLLEELLARLDLADLMRQGAFCSCAGSRVRELCF